MKYRNLSTAIGIASGSLFSALLVNPAFGATGINESYIILNLGSGNIFYDLSAITANPDFSGANLGTFNATGANSSILFKGGEVKTFKNGGSDVFGAGVDYRVRLGAGSGAFTVNALNFGAEIGGGNQQWIKTDYSTQLISNGMSAGVYSLDAYAKASTSDGDRFANNSGSNYTATFTIQATDYTWSGGGGTGATGTSTNWVGGVTPGQGHNLIFNNTNNSQVSITNAFTTINALTFSAGTTSAFTISGTAFTLGNGAGLTGITATSGITNSGSATQTVNAALTLGNAVTFGASGGSITLGGSTLNLGTNRLTVSGTNNTTISNLISSTSIGGNILKSDSGTLILSGANTYSGNTEINNGTVRVDANPGNATSNYFVGNGGTTGVSGSLLLGGVGGTGGGITLNNAIQANQGSGGNRVIGGSNTTGTNTFGGTVTLTDSNVTLRAATGGIVAFNTITAASLQTVAVGTIGDTGTVRMGGTADNLNIAATVNFGTLELAKTSTASVHALGSLLTVNSGATAKLTGTGGDQIFDSASAIVNTSGVFDLNGQNETVNVLTLNGTGISGGGALINNNGTTTSTITANGGITLGSTSSIGGSANITTSNVISGLTFGVTKVGTGTLTLTGSNAYTGATTISGGILSLGNGSLTGSLSASSVITNNANLTINRSNAVTQGTNFSGSAISGSGSLTQAGSGVTTLTAANTYTGGTTVSVGTLLANNITGSATGSGTVAVSGATLGGSGTISGGTTLTTATLAPGSAAATVGILTFGAGLALDSTSIFEWDMQQTAATDPGAAPAGGGINAGTYDKVGLSGAANSLTGSGAVFKVILGSGKNFADAFWDTNKTWNNIFTGNGVATNLAAIFNTINANGLNLSGGLVAGEGTFTLNGTSTLNWTAVPEPSSALAGLLLAAGLLRRRRA